MFSDLCKGVMADIAIRILAQYRHLSVRMLKIEVAKVYIHGIRLARLSVLGLILMLLVIGLIGGGVLFLHAGVFILLPWTIKAKALLGVVLGTVYVVAGILLLRLAMNENTWLKKSGCVKMLEDLTAPSEKI